MSAAWSEPAVVVVTGIQAAGKSTVGRMLAERLARAAFIDGDGLARMVLNGRERITSEPSQEAVAQLHLRCRQAAALADSFHGAGFTAVMADNVYGADLAGVVAHVCARPNHRRGARAERRVRRGARAGAWNGRPRGLEEGADLARAVAEFQGYLAATPRLGLWLDSSGQKPEATVDAVIARAWTEGRVR